MPPTLEELLRTKVSTKGVEHSPDFRIAVQRIRDDGVQIIVHPHGHDGTTLDLIVTGNEVRPLG